MENLSYKIKQAAIIESKCFSEPWNEEMIHSFMENGNPIFILFENNTGYLLASCVLDECELLRIAVLPQHRNKGLADKSMSEFIGKAFSNGMAKIFLEVRADNNPAVNLYEKHGFKKIASRRGYYHNPPGDAIIMESSLK